MNTSTILLTNSPTLITNKKVYLQGINGNFLFAFSDKRPTLDIVRHAHVDNKIYIDENLGNLWVWKKYSWKTKLIVSKSHK
ncbi:hypothetical protein [Acinetobacter pollinis]|jgi:hypothetical protein|uniref:hypothetical protein n=1 Tax=Acinetobacter pollinis TaxID=2605270 RepID=UPI0018C327FD|nr:hypothetical protein [Acinetobacter pollinis]MBF7693166.1 hypothetical protein [Acinetobacter pollinis]MBF7700845.1 hypothetical protein [Acinetobacter pollinis]